MGRSIYQGERNGEWGLVGKQTGHVVWMDVKREGGKGKKRKGGRERRKSEMEGKEIR